MSNTANAGRYSREREKLFDLDQTEKLSKLAQVPAAERDRAWVEQLTTAAWHAALEVGPVFLGPDGFPYLRLQVPRPEAEFAANALGNLIGTVLDKGLGVVVFASPEAAEPVYVFSMGLLGSMLAYDSWEGDATDLAESLTATGRGDDSGTGLNALELQKGQRVLVGAPSEAYLQPYTARALYRHLREGWKVEEPRVALLVIEGNLPSRNLVINRKLSEFPEEAAAGREVNRLLWYLPPKRSLMLMPEDWDQSRLQPLAGFFPI